MKRTAAYCLLQVLLASSVYSLQCYRCTYNDLRTNTFLPDALENLILDTFRTESDVNCRMDDPQADMYRVHVRTCPEPSDARHMYKCATVQGVTTGEMEFEFLGVSTDFDVMYDTIERDCVEVPKADPLYTDGVHDQLPSSGPGRYLIERTFEGLDIGNVRFEGTAEYRSTGVDVPGLQCPHCTYSSLDSDGHDDFLSAVLGRFAEINEPECQMENLSEDRHEVRLRNCPAEPEGHRNVCWSVHGVMSATLGGRKFTYTTVDRDCTSVPVDDADHTDGCHDTSGDPSGVAAVIHQTYEGLGMDGLNFTGKSCYNSGEWETFVTEVEAHIGSSTSAIHAAQHGVLLLLLTTAAAALLYVL